MRFPAELLRPTDGGITAQVFKNDRAGVPETLFWEISVDFAPVGFIEGPMPSSLAVDWIRLPVRDWRELSGLSVGDPGASVPHVARHISEPLRPDTYEASFYILGHDMADRCRIAFGERTGASFRVSIEMDVDLLGYGDNGPDGRPDKQRVAVTVDTVLPFSGVKIDEYVVPPGEAHTAEAIAALSRHLDTDTFQPPTAQLKSFHFAPLIRE